MLAIQILDQCCQLRYFSAIIDHDRMDAPTTASSIMSCTRISMNLPAIRTLNLAAWDHAWNEFDITFLEYLLPHCPNLRTFSIDLEYFELGRRLLDPYWWSHVLASNSKLKRISLRLHGNGVFANLSEEVLQ
ncbi:unnamed protein product, partial [Rotaria sp. Silwood1]